MTPAGPVQNLYRLLLFRFNRNFLTGLLNRHPESPCIHHIVFVTHDERFDEASLQQPNFMPLFFQLTRPVLRAPTGLHANQARLPVTEKCQKILTANLLIYHFTYVLIDEVT